MFAKKKHRLRYRLLRPFSCMYLSTAGVRNGNNQATLDFLLVTAWLCPGPSGSFRQRAYRVRVAGLEQEVWSLVERGVPLHKELLVELLQHLLEGEERSLQRDPLGSQPPGPHSALIWGMA